MTLKPKERFDRLTGGTLARYGVEAGYKSAQKRADVLGISRSHLLHVERGAVWPSEALITRMADAYVRDTESIIAAARLCRRRLAQRMLEQAEGL